MKYGAAIAFLNFDEKFLKAPKLFMPIRFIYSYETLWSTTVGAIKADYPRWLEPIWLLPSTAEVGGLEDERMYEGF